MICTYFFSLTKTSIQHIFCTINFFLKDGLKDFFRITWFDFRIKGSYFTSTSNTSLYLKTSLDPLFINDILA